MEGSLNPAVSHSILDQYAQMIDSEVQSDPKKLYTYNDFLTEVTGLKSFCTTRYNYLSALPSINTVAPTIGSVEYGTNGTQWQQPLAFEAANIKATVSSSNGLSEVNMYYADGLVGNFTKVEMFDDGQHNDDGANDD